MSIPNCKKSMNPEEVMLLINLVESSPIIRSKETNAATNKLKEQAWVKLTDDYNAENVSAYKNVNQLKLKWDNLKKAARKREDFIRMHNQDGGGTIPRDDAIDKVITLLKSTYNGAVHPQHTTPSLSQFSVLPLPTTQASKVPLHTTPQSPQYGVVPQHNTPQPSPTLRNTTRPSPQSDEDIQHNTPRGQEASQTEKVELVDADEVESDADLEPYQDHNGMENQAKQGNTSNTMSSELTPTEKLPYPKPKMAASLKSEGKKKKGNSRMQIYDRGLRGSYLSQHYKEKSLRTKLENQKLQMEIEKLKLEIRLLELEVAYKQS